MGVDLVSSESGEETGFGYGGWAYVLEIAEKYGWQPQGTERPPDLDASEPWEGEYGSSDGQRVTAEDARALADALDAAVADPQLHVTVLKMDAKDRRRIRKQMGPELAASYVGVKDFEEYRECLREFSAFCRKGAFRIE
jgi:hypothetical protein